MKIAFIGSGKYGWYCLRNMLETGKNIVAVFTLDERLAATKSTFVSYTDLAEKYGVPLIRVHDINNATNINRMIEIAPDLIVVSSWSQIIKSGILNIPPLGCIGIHFGLLPANRGGAPLNWALIRGEKKWGISLIYLDRGIDTGDIIAQKSFDITYRDDVKTVYDKATVLSIDLFNENLSLIEQGKAPRISQDQAKATYHQARKPADGLINWKKTARELYNWIRALTHPYPGAFSFLGGHKVVIWQARMMDEYGSYGAAGEISEIRIGEGIVVNGSVGRLLITRLEPDDSAEMWADEFAQRYAVQKRSVFVDSL